MKNESIWLDGIDFKKGQSLNRNIEVDVLIIGGGITGLSTAYHLINSNLKVCLVEKNLIAHAISARTTGKLTYLQDDIYSFLSKRGEKIAKKYLESQKEAIDIVENIINKNKIECNYNKVDSYIYTDKRAKVKLMKNEEQALKNLNVKINKSKKIPLEANSIYALEVSDTAVFHPVKYLKALKKIIIDNKIDIYENSNVTEIRKINDKYKCYVGDKYIIADKIIVACHYPFFLLPFLAPLKTSLEKSYLSASKVEKSKNFSAITISKPTKSIRYHSDIDNYLIFVTESHNLCNQYNYKEHFNCLLDYIPNLKPEFIWSNHDILTPDRLPYIGYIDNDILIGTGYNTWGMTNGSLAGKILADLVIGKKNKYEDLFNPKRDLNIFDKMKLPIDMLYSGKSFLENKVFKNKQWYKNVKIENRDGDLVGIYIDENKKEHIVYNVCPHLKCNLIFNEVEKTWDCPCHGSRFDIDGKCIMGPSKYNISYKR